MLLIWTVVRTPSLQSKFKIGLNLSGMHANFRAMLSDSLKTTSSPRGKAEDLNLVVISHFSLMTEGKNVLSSGHFFASCSRKGRKILCTLTLMNFSMVHLFAFIYVGYTLSHKSIHLCLAKSTVNIAFCLHHLWERILSAQRS